MTPVQSVTRETIKFRRIPMSLADNLTRALASRRQRDFLYSLPDFSTESGLIDFLSYDYLLFSQSSDLRKRFIERLQESKRVLGPADPQLLASLEARLAKFFLAPAALLFNSGTHANMVFFSCVPKGGDVIVFDEYMHPSAHDGLRLSPSSAHITRVQFKHNSVPALRRILKRLW